jgi:hypothetical protein
MIEVRSAQLSFDGLIAEEVTDLWDSFPFFLPLAGLQARGTKLYSRASARKRGWRRTSRLSEHDDRFWPLRRNARRIADASETSLPTYEIGDLPGNRRPLVGNWSHSIRP